MTKRFCLALAALAVFGVLAAGPARGQDSRPGADIESLKRSAPRVYIDCGSCDIDYIKTEVTFVNYVRDRDEAAASLHRELTEQFKRLMTASEHFQNATAQLKTAEEIATKNLQAAERLPFQMQEKITDFTRQIAEAENAEKVAVEQELTLLRSTRSEHLATVADRILKAAAEYTKLEAEAPQQLAAAAELEPKLAGVLTAIDARVAALAGRRCGDAPTAAGVCCSTKAHRSTEPTRL